uniref:EF-hand domain-containing protein n=1 Tax=Alexandrium monilatum TaxID=311494 RepID=A0A7S4RKS7_9DINO
MERAWQRKAAALLAVGGAAGLGVWWYRQRGQTPHLRRYFRRLMRHEREIWALRSEGLAALRRRLQSLRPEAAVHERHELVIEAVASMRELEERMLPGLEADLELIVERVFDWYDTDRTGVLSPCESAAFFSHFVQEMEAWLRVSVSAESLGADIVASMDDALSGRFSQLDEDQQEFWKDIVDGKVFAVARVHGSDLIKAAAEDYRAHQLERNSAAFGVLDTDGDGRLQQTEVLEGLLPTTQRGLDFLAALGLLIGPKLVRRISKDFGLDSEQ